MFKFLLYISLTIFSSQNLFAKTFENSIGIDLLSSYLNFHPVIKYNNPSEIIHSAGTNSSNKISFGIKYNFLIYYKKFFISPGLFYEANNVLNYLNKSSLLNYELQDAQGTNYVKIKKRLGFKSNIGYNFNENISSYFTIGKAMNYIQTYGGNYFLYDYYDPFWGFNFLKEFPFGYKNQEVFAPFYGVGLKIKINQILFLDLEYNYSKFKVSKNFNKYIEPFDYEKASLRRIPYDIDYNVVMNIFKLGISYNF